MKQFYCIKLLSFIIIFIQVLLLPYAQTGSKEYILATEKWPPFRIEDQNNTEKLTGIDIDIIEVLSKKINIKIAVTIYPWARCLENLKTGQSDLIIGLAYSKDREEYIYYLKPSYHYVKPVFYTKKGKGKKIAKYADLYIYSIGVSNKSVYFEPFNSDFKLRKIDFLSENQMLKLLSLDRVDVIIGTEPNISYDILMGGYKELFEKAVYEPDAMTELFIGISKKSVLMSKIKEFENALISLKTEKVIEKILNKYK